MAKRPAFTPDEARKYIAQEQALRHFRGQMPKNDRQAQRVALALSQGKRGREVYRHGGEQKQVTRARQHSGTLSISKRSYTEWVVGPTVYEDRHYGQQPDEFVPQVADLKRLLLQHSSTPIINMGIYGWLNIYAPGDTAHNQQWVLVHTYVDRELTLRLLDAAPDRPMTSTDPWYLALAHALVAGNTIGEFAHASEGWQWGAVYRWSVRDVHDEQEGRVSGRTAA